MHHDMILAGFGGQGVMLIGRMLAYAGMNAGCEVSWLPSYGPEMRGGTANCTVVVSDKPVGSPVIQNPEILLAMNLPSLDRFEPFVKKGGVIVVNSSLINRSVARDDVLTLEIPVNDMAIELGNPRCANIIALGAVVGASEVLPKAEVLQMVKENFAAKPKLVDLNVNAFETGYEQGQKARQKYYGQGDQSVS